MTLQKLIPTRYEPRLRNASDQSSLSVLGAAQPPAAFVVSSPWSFLRFFAILLGILSFNQTAAGADLTDVRTGFHKTYSRLVLQFDSEVRFQIVKGAGNNAVTVDVLDVQTVRNFGRINMNPEDRFLRNVRIRRSANLLSVTAILWGPQVRFEHYFLKWPFRIVLDIYPTSAGSAKNETTQQLIPETQNSPENAILEISPENDSLQTANVDSFSQTVVLGDTLPEMAPISYDSTGDLLARSIIPLENALTSVKSQLRDIVRKRSVRKNGQVDKQTLIVAIIAGFVLLDLIILVAYLMRRSKRRQRIIPRTVVQRKRQPVSRVPNSEFVDMLKSSLEGRVEIEEIRKEPEGQQLNDLTTANTGDLESLVRQAMRNRRAGTPTRPGLSDVVKELGTIAPASRVSKEIRREDLIGKDGAEFLKKLRKQPLN